MHPRRITSIRAGFLAVFAFAVVSPAQVVTELPLNSAGVGSLTEAAVSVFNVPPDEVQGRVTRNPRRPIPSFNILGNVWAAALAIPNPPGLRVVGPDPDFFGFPGLNTID